MDPGSTGLAFAVVATASLVTLPVTWFHYPVALLPTAVLLAVAHRRRDRVLTAAAVIAAIAIAWLPLTWLAVALLLAAWRAALAMGPSSSRPRGRASG